MRFTVDAIGEIQRIGITAVHATNAEVEGPKAAWRLAITRVYVDRPDKRPRIRIEGVDLAAMDCRQSGSK